MRRLYNYFILSPLIKIIIFFAVKSNGKVYEKIFNFYSLLFKSPNRISFKKNYFLNKEINWRFTQKWQGIYAYGKGFKVRKNDLINEYLIKKLNIDNDDIVIDVGANNGDFYLCFDKKIKYYGYEPSPLVFSDLKYNIRDQNIFNLGLSNSENNKVSFYLNDEYGDSSIIPIKNYTKKIEISTTTLDREIDKIQNKIKLIKIEAEGYEPEVLQGLQKNLINVEYITIDCGPERGIEEENTIADCSNYLIQNNFAMIDLSAPRIGVLFKNLNY
jgi:FkbM family methyltransferase